MAKRSKKNQVASDGVFKNVTTTNVGVQRAPSWFRHDWLWGLILMLVRYTGLYAGLAGGIYLG